MGKVNIEIASLRICTALDDDMASAMKIDSMDGNKSFGDANFYFTVVSLTDKIVCAISI